MTAKTANVTITRLNHIVLWVRDARKSLAFYQGVLDFQPISEPTDRGVFLRASGSDNHHDLALFSIGADAPGPTKGKQVGMYHAAFEVATIEDLARAREALIAAGALVGETDHGASLSLYINDPDGNELEIFWLLPREEWETRNTGNRRLDLAAEIAQRSAAPA
jgi:catechol-2,3-dioxygenase